MRWVSDSHIISNRFTRDTAHALDHLFMSNEPVNPHQCSIVASGTAAAAATARVINAADGEALVDCL